MRDARTTLVMGSMRKWARSSEEVDPRQHHTGAQVATHRSVVSYNGGMNEENNEKLPPVEDDAESPAPVKPEKPEMPAEFVAARASQATKTKWGSDSRPGKWATIGCGLGIVVLIAALFAGSSLMRKTVWASYAGANRRLTANLPGDLPPADRMRLKTNLERFAAYMKGLDDPFPVMGEFQALVRGACEDRLITRDEVEEIDAFLESKVNEGALAVPYSMP